MNFISIIQVWIVNNFLEIIIHTFDFFSTPEWLAN